MLSHQSYLFLFCFSQCKLKPSTVKLHCSTSTSLQNDNGCLFQEDCISRFLLKRVLSGGYVWNQWLVVAWSTPFTYFESLGTTHLAYGTESHDFVHLLSHHAIFGIPVIISEGAKGQHGIAVQIFPGPWPLLEHPLEMRMCPVFCVNE